MQQHLQTSTAAAAVAAAAAAAEADGPWPQAIRMALLQVGKATLVVS
jgi:hypothetical protein